MKHKKATYAHVFFEDGTSAIITGEMIVKVNKDFGSVIWTPHQAQYIEKAETNGPE